MDVKIDTIIYELEPNTCFSLIKYKYLSEFIF